MTQFSGHKGALHDDQGEAGHRKAAQLARRPDRASDFVRPRTRGSGRDQSLRRRRGRRDEHIRGEFAW